VDKVVPPAAGDRQPFPHRLQPATTLRDKTWGSAPLGPPRGRRPAVRGRVMRFITITLISARTAADPVNRGAGFPRADRFSARVVDKRPGSPRKTRLLDGFGVGRTATRPAVHLLLRRPWCSATSPRLTRTIPPLHGGDDRCRCSTRCGAFRGLRERSDPPPPGGRPRADHPARATGAAQRDLFHVPPPEDQWDRPTPSPTKVFRRPLAGQQDSPTTPRFPPAARRRG